MENEHTFTDGKSDEELKKMATETAKHLRGVSNQTMTIPIMGFKKDPTITELIVEVESLTPTGLKYINAFFEIKEFIREKRES